MNKTNLRPRKYPEIEQIVFLPHFYICRVKKLSLQNVTEYGPPVQTHQKQTHNSRRSSTSLIYINYSLKENK